MRIAIILHQGTWVLAAPSADAVSDAFMIILLWMGIACIVVAAFLFLNKVLLAPVFTGVKAKKVEDGEIRPEPDEEEEAEDFTIEKLDTLRKTGVLTEEEFVRARAKIIAKAAAEFGATPPATVAGQTGTGQTPGSTAIPSTGQAPGQTVGGSEPSQQQPNRPRTSARLPMPGMRPSKTSYPEDNTEGDIGGLSDGTGGPDGNPSGNVGGSGDSKGPAGSSPNSKNGELW